MARHPSRRHGGLMQAKASYSPSVSSNYGRKDRDPFGPAMANDIFGVYDYDECEEVCDDSSNYYSNEDVFPEEYWYQTELPLESVREMEDRLQREITKFERAYRAMITCALKWHYLMEECDENPQVEKMFKDMQMIRKLTGSEVV